MFFHWETRSEQHLDSKNSAAYFPTNLVRKMATVYKSLARANGEKSDAQSDARKKNRQRVLILSSRGVTYRFVVQERKR